MLSKMEQPTKPVEKEVELSQNAMTFEERLKVLQRHRDYFCHHSKISVGFQGNHDLSFSRNKLVSSHNAESNGNYSYQINDTGSVLEDFWKFHINNKGDPFIPNGNVMETKNLEVAVLDYFAKIWRIEEYKNPQKINRAYWGYVSSNGATEANTLALFNARDYLTGKRLLCDERETRDSVNSDSSHNGILSPVVFYSQEAYYGHVKTLHMLQMKSFNDVGSGQFPCPLQYPEDYPSTFSEEMLDQNGWPYTVPCDENDTMHIPSLLKLVSFFLTRGHPPIIIFTSGSTSTGAYDNPQEAISQLVPVLKRHNMYERRVYSSENPEKFEIRNGFWFHVDAAFGAAHLPFLEMAINKGLLQNMFANGFPVFDFRIPEITSISMSIYKWFGLPFPAGVYMMRGDHQLQPLSSPGYAHVHDNTLTGSRSGHGVLLTWDLLSKHSYQDFTEEVIRAENLMTFLLRKLHDLEKVHGEDLWITRSPGSLIVSFKSPKEEILWKYSLPTFERYVIVMNAGKRNLQKRVCARISVVPAVQLQRLEMILNEFEAPGAFPTHPTSTVNY